MRRLFLSIAVLAPLFIHAMDDNNNTEGKKTRKNRSSSVSQSKRPPAVTQPLEKRRGSQSSDSSLGFVSVSTPGTPPDALSNWASVEGGLDVLPEEGLNRSGTAASGAHSDVSSSIPNFVTPRSAFTPSEAGSSDEDYAKQQLLTRAHEHLKENPSAITSYKRNTVIYSAGKAAGTSLVLGCVVKKVITSDLWESLMVPQLPDKVVDAIDRIQDPKIFLGVLGVTAFTAMVTRALTSLITINSTPPTSAKIDAMLSAYTLSDETKNHLKDLVAEYVHNVEVVDADNNAHIQEEITALEAQKTTLAQKVTDMKAYTIQLNQQEAAVSAAQHNELIAHSTAVQKTSQEIKERLDTLNALYVQKAEQQRAAATKTSLFGRK